MIDCLRSFCLVKLRGFAHLVAPGLVSMVLLCMIVKPLELVDRTEMRKTDCFGKTRLVPHVPSCALRCALPLSEIFQCTIAGSQCKGGALSVALMGDRDNGSPADWAGHARRIRITVLAASAKDLASPDVAGFDETGRNGETATAAAGAGAEAVVAVTTPPSRCAVEPAIGCHTCCAAMQGRRDSRDTSTCMNAGGYILATRKMLYINKPNAPYFQLTHYLSRSACTNSPFDAE